MGLPVWTPPNINNAYYSTEPIYSSLYDCIFISSSNEYIVSVENIKSENLILDCTIQNSREIGIDIIKNTNLIILNQYNIARSLIKFEVFFVKNTNLSFSFNWSSDDLSIINASYEIINVNSFTGDNIYSELVQFKRDLKINSILN